MPARLPRAAPGLCFLTPLRVLRAAFTVSVAVLGQLASRQRRRGNRDDAVTTLLEPLRNPLHGDLSGLPEGRDDQDAVGREPVGKRLPQRLERQQGGRNQGEVVHLHPTIPEEPGSIADRTFIIHTCKGTVARMFNHVKI